jgi:hypothetical protein
LVYLEFLYWLLPGLSLKFLGLGFCLFWQKARTVMVSVFGVEEIDLLQRGGLDPILLSAASVPLGP